ncbi:hypothetical protein MNB_SV-15-459 [hydrothermal vent metagenome]|uniref:DUF2249 domain-containing protein n=1 Tax=hydrothermal vent metagenome TaxID=652676 RepID=A0A1W1EIZ1_9ZZZZ
MSLIPEQAEQIEVNGATVPFYKYEKDGLVHYQFDSSLTGHPEPMVNAMSGLQLIKNNEKLVMINSKAPMGLFPKIQADFDFEYREIDGGKFEITFTKKSEGDAETDFTDTACSGS